MTGGPALSEAAQLRRRVESAFGTADREEQRRLLKAIREDVGAVRYLKETASYIARVSADAASSEQLNPRPGRPLEANEGTRRYILRTRGERIGMIALFSLVGGSFVFSMGGWSLGLIRVNQKAQPSTGEDWTLVLVISSFGLLALFFAWNFLVGTHEVRLADDGTIEFRRTIGVSRTTVGDIQEMHKFVENVGLEDDDARRVRLTYVGGSTVLSSVTELEPFFDELSKRNPNITRVGSWPSD